MMHSNTDSYRLPAEWEPATALLMAFPHKDTDWSYMLDEVTECFGNIVSAASRYGKVIIVAPDVEQAESSLSAHIKGCSENIVFVQAPTNDTWARDFGPISLISEEYGKPVLLDYKFNGWGLKFAADKDNLITSNLFAKGALKGVLKNRLGFVLEGGSIESDGKGTILTTSECLLSPNRNGDLTKAEIERRLLSDFNARRVLWLDHGYLAGDDTDSHIDTLARFAPNDTILYVKSYMPDDEHNEELEKMEKQLFSFKTSSGLNYNLIGLPLPEPVYDEEGNRLPATYANFLIFNNAVLLPVYGQPANDLLAEQMMKIVFPEHDIIPIDCSALIRQHGSLHCMTMQLPLQ